MLPKSATSPVAIGISEGLGGAPSLTAFLVILTGIIGAIIAAPLLNALRLTDYQAHGFATGTAAHGIGAALAFQVNETAGGLRGDRHGPERRADGRAGAARSQALLLPAEPG